MNNTIKFDLHTHSIASGHGTQYTINMIAKTASQLGLTVLGICDHGPDTLGSANLSYFRNLSLAPRIRDGVRIFYGVEANICNYTGKLDVPDEILEALDYCIISMHTANFVAGSKLENTQAYIAAMNHPNVKIIGHCDDTRFPIDYDILLSHAIKKNIWIELNNSSLYPEQYRGNATPNLIHLLELHAHKNYPILLSSDSHGCNNIGNYDYVLSLIDSVSFPRELILNYHTDCLNIFHKT